MTPPTPAEEQYEGDTVLLPSEPEPGPAPEAVDSQPQAPSVTPQATLEPPPPAH